MSPQRTDSPSLRNGTKTTALVALIAALLGGTGGIAITPHTASADLVTKTELREQLGRIEDKLGDIQTAITTLSAEAAVARYEREHRSTP